MARAVKRRDRGRDAAIGPRKDVSRRSARVYREMEMDGAPCWALFDDGARRDYVVSSVARRGGVRRLPSPLKARLWGRVSTIREVCLLGGRVDGHEIAMAALVVDRLFADPDGRPVEVVVGMHTMVTWGIRLHALDGRLEFSPRSEAAYDGGGDGGLPPAGRRRRRPGK